MSVLTRAADLLSKSPDQRVEIATLRAGDLGAVISRQAIIYAEEYDWNRDYEALIARILADFSDNFDGTEDQAWIARVDDTMARSIFLTNGEEDGVAKLRFLRFGNFDRLLRAMSGPHEQHLHVHRTDPRMPRPFASSALPLRLTRSVARCEASRRCADRPRHIHQLQGSSVR